MRKFIYSGIKVLPDQNQIHFCYQLEALGGKIWNLVEKMQFEPEILIGLPDLGEAGQVILETTYLLAGISYYKAYIPAQIECQSFILTPGQLELLKTAYIEGLGQFYVESAPKLAEKYAIKSIKALQTYLETAFSSITTASRSLGQIASLNPSNYLVSFGGGKDSLVSLELIRQPDRMITLFWKNNAKELQPNLWLHPGIKPLVAATGCPVKLVERQLDPQLIQEINQDPDSLNGHVPVAVHLMGLAALVAALTNCQTIVFSNEKSADEPSLILEGVPVNHQWSKSSQAEKLIQNVFQQDAGGLVELLNPLREHYELWITKELIKYPQYLRHFSSCNRNFVIKARDQVTGNSWCGNCPKCAFVFLMLRAFLPAQEVEQIMGQDLSMQVALEKDFRGLLGLDPVKPFECVGTREEAQAALFLAEKIDPQAFQSGLLAKLWSEVKPLRSENDWQSLVDKLLQ